MVRPLSRKDIFYSGSVTNLKEYQSQKSLTDYRNSVVSLTRFEKEHRHDVPRYQDVESLPVEACPCLPPAFKAALASMLDVSLLKDPAFMLIGISNLFGMAALYIPFFYLVDAAVKDVSDFSLKVCKLKLIALKLSGNSKRKLIAAAVNYWHNQYVRSYRLRIRRRLSVCRFTVPEQHVLGLMYDISWVNAFLCLFYSLRYYGFLLWIGHW